jgi:ATP-dependent RNA helicase SUPV3L1/SUV3
VTPGGRALPAGNRRAASLLVRVDMAQKLFPAAHEPRAKASGRGFPLDPALATSMGLAPDNYRHLMREAGFRAGHAKPLPEGAFGPPAPAWWSWRPPRKDRLPDKRVAEPARDGAFAALAGLVR